MMIAIPPKEGKVFANMNLIELTNILRGLADHVNLVVFASYHRTPKKARRVINRTRPSKQPHISTAKILSQNKALLLCSCLRKLNFFISNCKTFYSF
jgi:hypothetical protein